jgi:aryl-alcohol dehydrogenase-like predicted oxidoreductase
MRYTTFGRTGLRVSELVLGAKRFRGEASVSILLLAP